MKKQIIYFININWLLSEIFKLSSIKKNNLFYAGIAKNLIINVN